MISASVSAGIEHLHRSWGWLLALGGLMIALGIVALCMIPIATIAAALVLGWLMLFSGIAEGVHAFKIRRWGGVFLHIAIAILGVALGLLIIIHPVAGALAWTLALASLFAVVGIFRIVAAIRLKFLNWGWAVFDGAITLALGVLLWLQWPVSGFWFLGLAVGISLLFRGWSYVMLALAVRTIRLPGDVPGSSIPRAA